MSEQTRFFTTFDDVAQSAIILNSPLNLEGDFDISLQVSYEEMPPFACLLSGENLRVSIRGTNSGQEGSLFIDGAGFGNLAAQASPPFLNRDLSTVSIRRRGAVWAFFINGQEVLSVTRGTGAISVGTFARNISTVGGNDVFGGIISDVKITSNNSLLLDLPIDQNYTPTNNIVRDESINANNGTFVNVAEGDSELYTNTGEGSWEDTQGNLLDIAPLVIPTPPRITWNTLASHLRTQGFTGSDNDVIYSWLCKDGYIGTLNDALNTYLRDVEALQNSLTDNYANWRNQ